jgi:hypothetical protein
MNLEDFIRDSLVQITKAVSDANAINPQIASHEVRLNHSTPSALKGPVGAPVHIVEFDIAVTASRDASVGGGLKGGIISVVSGSLDSKLATSNESVSRLKFSVPVFLSDPNK